MTTQGIPFNSRIIAIEEAARLIYGNSEIGSAIDRGCAAARADIADILSRRGTTHPVIAVIGPKNAGKTTLCQWLLRKPEDRARLLAGYGKDKTTRKTTWIGPETPRDMDPTHEQEIPVSSHDLEDLGTPYTLVDVPGFNDDDPAAAAASRRAFRLSTVVILVASQETMEAGQILREMAVRDGVRVLPVVVVENEEEMRQAITSQRDRIRRVCPKSDVLEPLPLPYVGSTTGEERADREQSARTRLTEAMKDLLAMEAVDPLLLAETRFERLRADLREAVGELVTDVQGEYNQLVETETLVIGEITSALAGNERQLQAACRLRLLDSLSERCSPWFFPYRSFLRLLTLAAGAWDRLVFGFLGSLPSLIMTVVQSGRNVKVLAEKRRSLRDAVEERAKGLATERLAPVSQNFLRAIRRRLPEDARERLLMAHPEPAVVGLGAAESAVASAFEEGIAKHAPGNRVSSTLGVLSLVLVILLASGPITVVYRHYFDAWSKGFNYTAAPSSEVIHKGSIPSLTGGVGDPNNHASDPGDIAPASPAMTPAAAPVRSLSTVIEEYGWKHDRVEGPSWRNFPAPSAGMLLATTMLVFAPAFLLAMISLVVGVTAKRVEACASAIFGAVESRLRQLAADNILRLEMEDPTRNAVRVLFDEAGRPRIRQ